MQNGQVYADTWTYVVTDIETDGPCPGVNSMRSSASVAVDARGTEIGIFEAVFEPLPGAAPNELTLAWFTSEHPAAWAAATTDPLPAPVVMADFAQWVASLPGPRAFAACPVTFDGLWIDYYLRRFTCFSLQPGPYETDRIFDGPGLCLRSYAAAVTGLPVAVAGPSLRWSVAPAVV